MRRAPGLLPIVMVLPALAGLAPASRPDPGPGPEGAPEERPAVPARPGLILITVDGLRADRLGCYTRGKIGSTPRIDALAARGVRFERAYAASPSTAPSTATVLTGTRPRIHGLFHDLGGRLAADVPSVAGILSRAGYRTGAVVGSFHLDSDRGLDRGFDLYQDDIAGIRKKGALLATAPRAAAGVAAGLDFIDAGDGPFFLWIDLYDPHSDHDPPGPLAERFAQDPYQGEVAHVDSQIGRLLEGLRSRGLEGATHVVLAGSHGEGLGDHQETGHGIYVYEGTIRVPLIVAPAGSRSGRVVRRVVGLIDVAPTILELLSARIPASMAGRSLVPLAGPAGAAGEKSAPAPRGRAYIVEAWQPWAAYGWSPMFAVIEGRRKVILGRRLEAFDLESDPAEERPIDPVPGWARDLAALAPSASLPPGPRPVSERTRRKVLKGVRALALPWDNSPICLEKQNWPDPRDLTSLNDSLFRARLAGDHGAAGTASTIAYEVLEQDPANYTALELILFLMVRNRRHEMILEPFELFQCNYPFRGAPYHLLGHYFERSDPEKAEGALQIYRLLEPWSEEPEYDLAVHYAGRGAIDLAFRHLKRSIELGAEDLEFIRGDGRLAALRKDPRFADLVGPVGP